MVEKEKSQNLENCKIILAKGNARKTYSFDEFNKQFNAGRTIPAKITQYRTFAPNLIGKLTILLKGFEPINVKIIEDIENAMVRTCDFYQKSNAVELAKMFELMKPVPKQVKKVKRPNLKRKRK